MEAQPNAPLCQSAASLARKCSICPTGTGRIFYRFVPWSVDETRFLLREHDAPLFHLRRNLMKVILRTAILIGALTVSAAALAAGPSDNSQASYCGATHGAFADSNGNFGFLGALGGTPGYHNGAVGQETGATGYNNSHVCGSPS